MAVDERAQLAETAEALTLWERTLEQFRGTMDSATYRDWMDYRIRATRAAALGVQVQLIAPVPQRPTVVVTASSERPEQPWTESELRFADGDR